jgi:RNA polymerase sigma-70 factor (ECF subfamily)
VSPDEKSELNAAMARLAAGDRSAARGVYDHLEAPVRRLCTKMLGAGHDADDASQEALAELFGKASEYDPSRDVLGWALTIAGWECRTIRKKRARARTTPLATDVITGAGPDPAAIAEERELTEALEAAIGDLRPDDRRVLDDVLADLRGDAAYRKRKERMIDRLRALVRRTYDLGS